MNNIANRPIKTLLVCMVLFCMPAHGAIDPNLKSAMGYDDGVLFFIKEHPLVLDNLKEIKYFHVDKYHVIYTYTTMFDEKKTCTARFGYAIFRPYVKFYGSNCPISKEQDEEKFFQYE